MLWEPLPEAQRLDAYYHWRELLFGGAAASTTTAVPPLAAGGGIIDADELGTLPLVSRTKKEKRPSTAPARIVPTVLEDLDDEKRPRTAPLPVRTYGDAFRGATRGPPRAPSIKCEPKRRERKGYNNVVYSVVVDSGVVTFTGTVLVALESPTPWASVRYTLDGAAPDRSSSLAQGPFEVSANGIVLRAKSCKRGCLGDELRVRFVRRPDARGVKERILIASKRAAAWARRSEPPPQLDTTTPRDAAAFLDAVRASNVVQVRKMFDKRRVSDNGTLDAGLVEACSRGDVLCASVILNHRDDKASDLAAAVVAACEARAFKCVRLLVDRRGADVDRADANGRSPLHVACAAGAAKCVDTLLKAGADVDFSAPDGERALHVACRRAADAATTPRAPGVESTDYDACCRALVDGGARLDDKFKGKRPIQWAALANAPHIVQTLLDAGSKPLPVKKGKTGSTRRPPRQ